MPAYICKCVIRRGSLGSNLSISLITPKIFMSGAWVGFSKHVLSYALEALRALGTGATGARKLK